ncbi:MAG: dephospho-CoA kinase [Burkholderiales bacterium PBB1]|nr:MAG: dephospho-CoA kinase [Burkholderiales bacterium PBB1]
MAAVPRGVAEPLRIGLTGGIGSGKSTVAALLASHGAGIVDTDAISRRLTAAGGRAIPALREAFGDSAIDARGALDRRQMRDLIFDDPAARHRLEAILHPMILADTESEAASLADSAVLVFDVPLLVESPQWLHRVHRVLVIDCSEATQIARVMQRSGWSQASVKAVIATQATREQRRAVADDMIVNDGISIDVLSEHVDRLWNSWKSL